MKDTIKHLEGKYTDATYLLIKSCTDEELRLYLYLKLHALSKNNAFPGYRTIEKELKWSGWKVKNTYLEMAKQNRLVIYKKSGKSNVYDITWYDELNLKGRKTDRAGFQLAKPLTELVSSAERLDTTLLGLPNKDSIHNDSLKTEKYPKSWYTEITDFHLSLSSKENGIDKPESNYGQATKQLKALFKKGYTVEQLKDLVAFYLRSKKCKEFGVAITNCFTPHTINLWLENGGLKNTMSSEIQNKIAEAIKKCGKCKEGYIPGKELNTLTYCSCSRELQMENNKINGRLSSRVY